MLLRKAAVWFPRRFPSGDWHHIWHEYVTWRAGWHRIPLTGGVPHSRCRQHANRFRFWKMSSRFEQNRRFSIFVRWAINGLARWTTRHARITSLKVFSLNLFRRFSFSKIQLKFGINNYFKSVKFKILQNLTWLFFYTSFENSTHSLN